MFLGQGLAPAPGSGTPSWRLLHPPLTTSNGHDSAGVLSSQYLFLGDTTRPQVSHHDDDAYYCHYPNTVLPYDVIIVTIANCFCCFVVRFVVAVTVVVVMFYCGCGCRWWLR